METRKQVYEVILETSDEELDGETNIQELLEDGFKNTKHIKSVSVEYIKNEWGED